MDVRHLAALAGVKVESVLEHKQVKNAFLLRIDLAREKALQARVEKRTGFNRQPTDHFKTDVVVDGASRLFVPEHLDKHRSEDWWDPDGTPRPAWRLSAEVYTPQASYGAVLEDLTFHFFENHQGSYELSFPPGPELGPRLLYSLGYLEGGQIDVVSTFATAGTIEINNVPLPEPEPERGMRLSAAFSAVHFDMPNIHEHLELAPDREFSVQLPSGFYEITGTW